jgi:hypothetical protein
MLISSSRNPVRDQLYDAQIKYHDIKVGRRQLVHRLYAETNKGQRYKQAYTRKILSKKNREN